MKPINYIPSLTFTSFIYPPPSHKYPPTHCAYFTVLSFTFSSKVHVQRGFSMCPRCEYALLCSVHPSLLLSLTLPSPPLLNSFQYGIVKSSTCADEMHFTIVDSLVLFSFPSSPSVRAVPLVPACSTHKCVCDHVGFMYALVSFGSCFFHLTLCCPIPCIYLQATWFCSSL
jgi:hypothetical protein